MKFTIKKNGSYVGTIKADDARQAGAAAAHKYGPGTYNVSLVRGTDVNCDHCGEPLTIGDAVEREGLCEACYDEFHGDDL